MARGRAAWKQHLDVKPVLGRWFRSLERQQPALTRALRYYSLAGTVPDDACFDHFSRSLKLDQGEYAAAYQALQIDNVDGFYPETPFHDVRFDAALLDGHFVCGHVMMPVSRSTGRTATRDGLDLPWGITYPSPSFKPERHIAGVALAVPRITNYYHLLIDAVLPAMAAVIRNPEQFPHGLTLLVNRDYQAVEFMAAILNDLGVETRLEKVGLDETVSADRFLWARSWSHSTGHSFAFGPELDLIGPLIDKRISHIPTKPRVVIPRSKTRLRNLVNQSEMLFELSRLNFETLELKWSNLLEQIAIFRRAETVVSVHGAALANLVWGKGGRVVEIFPTNARNTTFLHIASQNEWHYDCVFGNRERERQNFDLDVKDLLAVLA